MPPRTRGWRRTSATASSPRAATWATTAANRPNWTLGHPEKVKDWGLRAHYSVATAAKALSAAFYDSPSQYSYFEGCSNGGRQAMMMAQNYPELFDGIVAGAPSKCYPDLLMWLLWTGKTPDAGRRASRRSVRRQARGDHAARARGLRRPRRPRRRTDHQPARLQVRHRHDGPRRRRHAHRRGARGRQGDVRRHHQRDPAQQRYTGAKLGSEADWIPLFADNGGYGAFIEHFVYSLQYAQLRLAARDINFSKTSTTTRRPR